MVNARELANPHWSLRLPFEKAFSAGRHCVTRLSMKVSLHTAWAQTGTYQ